MKNIITALGNPVLNEKLIENSKFKIIAKDIQYQEGIFEVLEKEEKINYLILSEILPGENNIKELINKILEKNNKIKIILILENKNEKLQNIIDQKLIEKIYYN
ncbi:MAG: hypothetical protein GX682_06420, partial [Clostridiaceae bacterium]|nr:hypothetical protein [Clostridiaceae bacterium]